MKFFVVAVVLGFLAVPAFADPREISAQLEKIREKHQIPALTAAAIVEGQVVAIGATGNRSADDPTPERIRRSSRRLTAMATPRVTPATRRSAA